MRSSGKGVIFDLDGVLVDTSRFHLQSWYDLADREGYAMSDEFFYETFGMQNAGVIPRLAGRELPPEVIQEHSDWKEARYRELIAGQLKLLEGVQELLEDLRRNDFKLAIGSSTPRVNLEFMLANTGVERFFDAYATSEDVSRSKPAPDTFLAAARKMGLTPGQCVVIEDSIPGVRSGKAAGMIVVAVTNTRKAEELSEADRIVNSLVELNAADFDSLLQTACNS